MYFWNSYPFIRLSTILICGIIVFDTNQSLWSYSTSILLGLLGVSLASLILSWKIGFYKCRHLNGMVTLCLFLFLGGEFAKRQYYEKPANHYTYLTERVDGFSGKIISSVNERTNHFRYDLSLKRVLIDSTAQPVSGIIHLYVRKDSTAISLSYGDDLLIKGSFFEVSRPWNPNEFNYKKYLSRQNIFSHAFVRGSDLKIVSASSPNPLYLYASKIQQRVLSIIDTNIPEARENGIAKALLLGIKDHLDNDVKRSYSAAGAMHVLAVSGLHVGVIYLFLQYLLRPLRASAIGKKFFGIISILIIWSYAIITGLSPSVLRAATMFSVMAISNIQSRKGNIYNTLGVAAFLLLLFDPYLIYSVGFQLSFAAVFGIVYLQPKIYRLKSFDFWLLDKAWAITSVSIAAQLATFPLSAYYFHQFPTYFLISNLLVIPSATVMLLGGLLMVASSLISAQVGFWVGHFLSKFIWLINECIAFVEKLPHSLLDWIYIDQVGLVAMYGVIVSLIWGLHHRSFHTLLLSTSMLSGFVFYQFKIMQKQKKEEQVILYEMNGKIAIDHIKGHLATLYVDEIPDDLELLSFQINPNRLAKGLQPISKNLSDFESTPNFEKREFYTAGTLADQRILFFDSTTFHLNFTDTIATDILVIENQAVKNLEWLNSNFRYKHLVLGNKNPTFFLRKMKKQAEQLKQNIHSLKLDGAFILTIRDEKH